MLLSNYLSHSSGWRFCGMALSQHNFQLEKDSSWYRKHSNQNDCYDTGSSFICRHFFLLSQDHNGYIPVFPFLCHITFSKNECILSYKYNRKNSREWTSVEHFLIRMCYSVHHWNIEGKKVWLFLCWMIDSRHIHYCRKLKNYFLKNLCKSSGVNSRG